MSDKWISDDELEKILGEINESNDENRTNEEKLDDILNDLKDTSDEEEVGEGLSERGEKEMISGGESGRELYYEEPEQQVEVKGLNLEEFLSDESQKRTPELDFDSLNDIPVDVRVLLGSTEMKLEEIMDLRADSVVKLNKLAGEPVEIVIGEQIIAKGETVIIDDRFGVLITEIIPPRERIKVVEKKLRR